MPWASLAPSRRLVATEPGHQPEQKALGISRVALEKKMKEYGLR